MRRRPDRFEGLAGTRRSVAWFNDADEAFMRRLASADSGSGFYRHMFAEDLSHLVPYDRGSREGFGAELRGADDRLERLILDAIPMDYGPARTVQDAVRHFSSTSSRHLLSGPAALEIEYFHDQAGEMAQAFRLHFLPQGTFGRVNGVPVQWVPVSESPLSRRGRHYIRLQPDHVTTFDLPKDVRRDLRGGLRALVVADRHQFAPTSLLGPSGASRGFSVTDHREMVAAYGRAHTRALGWDGRGLFTEAMYEPYAIYRRLRFARFQSLVLKSIVGGLQEALDRVGNVLGFDVELELSGLPEPGDFDRAVDDLRMGSRSLLSLSRFSLGLPAQE